MWYSRCLFVCLSFCLLKTGVLARCLDVSPRNQCFMITLGLSFADTKVFVQFQWVNPQGGAKTQWGRKDTSFRPITRPENNTRGHSSYMENEWKFLCVLWNSDIVDDLEWPKPRSVNFVVTLLAFGTGEGCSRWWMENTATCMRKGILNICYITMVIR